MRTKEYLTKRLLIYIFSLFTLFVFILSCVSYDEDIDKINDKVEELQTQINDLKNKLETGNYVVSVLSINGGFKITFNDGKAYDIVNGKDGTNGTNGVQWAIGVDSIWYKDGVKTNPPLRAIGERGKQGVSSPSPEIYKKNGAEYWVVFKWDNTAYDFVPDTLWNDPVYNYNTYIVDKNAYSYELNVWNQDTNAYTKLILPKVNDRTSYILEFLGYKKIKTPSINISLDELDNDISFKFWYIGDLNDIAGGGSWGNSWNGRVAVAVPQVLTTLKRDSIAAIVRTTLTGSSWDITLKNTLGEALPITFEKPVKHTGIVTKVAESDSIYILQMITTNESFTSTNQFLSKFKMDGTNSAVYAFVDKTTGTKSQFNAFLRAETGSPTLSKAEVSSIGGRTKDGTGDYEINQNNDLRITFTNSHNLYDYYFEAEDPDVASEKFGLVINKNNGTFKVTKADEEKFKLKVYTLHYNGDIHTEIITIKPIVTTPTP
ncbi:MAG: DUF4988 domain-containing protein [Tannerellaceae bacterium]|nr:DUF4988 domain-containing protein [Tannerellaceae bacterium]